MSIDPNEQDLSVEEYRLLQHIDLITDGALANLLNAYGMAHFTVCPKCFCDDFTHVEGCEEA